MTLAVAFLGGVISCLSPCVLPVIPVFLAQLKGSSAATVAADGTIAFGRPNRLRALGFLLGFAGVFVVLWVSLGLGGSVLLQATPSLRPLAGGAMVILGLITVLGWRLTPLAGRWTSGTSFGGSLLLGTGVAVGWTPCIGPTLGAILTLAVAASSVWVGAALLASYALGMAVPLVLIAIGASRARPLMRAVANHDRLVRIVSGTLIIGVGILVATNGFARLAGLVPWVY
jgi:cytochrome c-type biogenesis protein